VNVFLNWSNTRTTWGFVSGAIQLLTAWAALGLGFLIIRRPKAVAPTLAFFGSCLLISGIGYFVPFIRGGYSNEMSVRAEFFSHLFAAPIAFFIAAVVAWKSRSTHRSVEQSRIACSQCGYDMRGLSEPRCPECGRMYTLDEFYQL